jgi:hypothetical protein
MATIISEDGKYRYVLTRQLRRHRLMHKRNPGTVLWVMLNPSTADADRDDPTIRRCRYFTESWGYEYLEVANVYALRATDPKELWKADYPVGPDNLSWLFRAAARADLVIIAWGKHARPSDVRRTVDILLAHNPALYCLGINGDGSPKHPLYLKSTTQPIIWHPELHL